MDVFDQRISREESKGHDIHAQNVFEESVGRQRESQQTSDVFPSPEPFVNRNNTAMMGEDDEETKITSLFHLVFFFLKENKMVLLKVRNARK